MNSNELFTNKKELNNSVDIIKDLVQGDPEALKRLDSMNLDIDAIKKALSFITQNDKISDSDKANLLKESWRINFRAPVPTPEEFLTEKYLGPTAKTIYPRIKNVFISFLDPTSKYRNLILYPHIGWGKDQPLYSRIYTKDGYKLMADVRVGDRVLSPDGSETQVIGTVNWKEDDVYELEMDDGSKMQCGPHHLHNVSYRTDDEGNKIWDTVETIFLLDHPELDFEFKKFEN